MIELVLRATSIDHVQRVEFSAGLLSLLDVAPWTVDSMRLTSLELGQLPYPTDLCGALFRRSLRCRAGMNSHIFLGSAGPMKRSSPIFLQVVVVLIGIGALALLLWEPHLEGRNANATLFQIYFNDLFLAYAYIASIPFFLALFQAFKVLGYAGQNRIFSPAAVKALRTIKYCGMAIVGFVAGGEVFILKHADKEDPGAGVFMGILIAFGSIVIATAAATFERILQTAVDLKSENDLTV